MLPYTSFFIPYERHYENSGAARVSGHRLGAASDVYNQNAGSDLIPGGTLTLKVMESAAAYGEGDIYEGESVTSYASTNGLYCASCHTPHGSVGGTDQNGDGVNDSPIPVNVYSSAGVLTSQQFYGDQLITVEPGHNTPPAEKVKAIKLISSNPNHLLERSLKREASADGTACPAASASEIANGIVTVGDDARCRMIMSLCTRRKKKKRNFENRKQFC